MAVNMRYTQRVIQRIGLGRQLRPIAGHGSYSPVLLQSRDFTDGRNNGVRIGCASGFWGDTAVSAPQLIHQGKLDYLVFDYLSEITMSLMTAAKNKFPNLGYAPDFVQVAVAPYIKDIKKKGVKVVSNAGGVNPEACAAALREVASKAGISLNIATITGDDVMPMKDAVAAAGITDLDSGLPFPSSVNSMNAYLGAGAISRALELGADIVVTGRCADSALVLGPLIHSLKWSPDNFDLMASGSLAGHLIECGAQATGGIFTDWHTVPDWHNIGFPIVECSSDGNFILTKPPKTGGLVSFATVAEQLVYEIRDPQNYVLADVNCDFSNVNIQAIAGREGEAVSVTGAKGKPPTDQYKVCATYLDGYRATAVAPIGGPRSAEKGQKTAEAIIKRTRGIFKQLGFEDYKKVLIQPIGGSGENDRDSVLWLAVQHSQKKALEFFAREIAPAGTGMAPGLTGLMGGRPKVSPVLKLFSFLYPKDELKIKISMNGEHAEDYQVADIPTTDPASITTDAAPDATAMATSSGSHSYRLQDLAYTRSGDKGNSFNIGVIARHPSYVPYLRQALTPDAVAAFFADVWESKDTPLENKLKRYEVPGIHGFNFVFKEALGGGGVASLRPDPQGKAAGQRLLDFKIDGVPDLMAMAK